MLIFLALSWKKNMSWMNMRPPACETVEKVPLRVRAAVNDSILVAPAHHAAVMVDRTRNQNRTGRRPAYALSMTTIIHKHVKTLSSAC
jgi:hypothetical protein